MPHASSSNERSRRYLRAGVVYGLLGCAIMGITVLTPELARPERRADLLHLLIGLPFFFAFALAIAFGDRAVAALLRFFRTAPAKAARLGELSQTVLTMILSVSALGRTFVFAANGLGQRPRLGTEPLRLYLESSAAEPRMLVNAVLMAVICATLASASWIPLWKRRGSNS